MTFIKKKYYSLILFFFYTNNQNDNIDNQNIDNTFNDKEIDLIKKKLVIISSKKIISKYFKLYKKSLLISNSYWILSIILSSLSEILANLSNQFSKEELKSIKNNHLESKPFPSKFILYYIPFGSFSKKNRMNIIIFLFFSIIKFIFNLLEVNIFHKNYSLESLFKILVIINIISILTFFFSLFFILYTMKINNNDMSMNSIYFFILFYMFGNIFSIMYCYFINSNVKKNQDYKFISSLMDKNLKEEQLNNSQKKIL